MKRKLIRGQINSLIAKAMLNCKDEKASLALGRKAIAQFTWCILKNRTAKSISTVSHELID